MGGVIANLQESAYFHRVQIYVESNWKITVTAGFMENLSVGGILGRNGFFDNFRVTFDQGVNPPEFEITKIVRPS